MNVEETLGDILKRLVKLEINQQQMLKSNSMIKPGIGPKISFDAKGLVTGSDELTISDIPDIPMNKVVGLETALRKKLGKNDLSTLQSSFNDHTSNKKEVVATGIRVNYDADGRIVSSSDLLSSDIPPIAISQVTGLNEKLESIQSMIPVNIESVPDKEKVINPGTAAKVAYDEYGRIIQGSSLGMNDIPIEIINRLNKLESSISQLASQRSLDALTKSNNGKVDGNSDIQPGGFTKVFVDKKGLVTKGTNLTVSDLPELQIKDIANLESSLRSKVEYNQYLELHATVQKLLEASHQIGSIIALQNSLPSLASQEEVKSISTRLEKVETLLNTILDHIPVDLLQDLLDRLSAKVDNIESKLNNLESH